MGVKFSVAPQALTSAGEVLRAAQQRSDAAVVAMARAAMAVTGHPASAGIGQASAAFGDAMATALADLGRSAQGLSAAVDTSARIYVTTDSDIAYRYGALASL